MGNPELVFPTDTILFNSKVKDGKLVQITIKRNTKILRYENKKQEGTRGGGGGDSDKGHYKDSL